MSRIQSFQKFNEGVFDFMKSENDFVSEFIEIVPTLSDRVEKVEVRGKEFTSNTRKFDFDVIEPGSRHTKVSTRFENMYSTKPAMRIKNSTHGQVNGESLKDLTIEIFYYHNFDQWYFDVIKKGNPLNLNKKNPKYPIEIKKSSTVQELIKLCNQYGTCTMGDWLSLKK